MIDLSFFFVKFCKQFSLVFFIYIFMTIPLSFLFYFIFPKIICLTFNTFLQGQSFLKIITKRQNIYTLQNNFENKKSLQPHNKKNTKIVPINTRLIYLVHDLVPRSFIFGYTIVQILLSKSKRFLFKIILIHSRLDLTILSYTIVPNLNEDFLLHDRLFVQIWVHNYLDLGSQT